MLQSMGLSLHWNTMWVLIIFILHYTNLHL
jgi:hypothetical protein